MARRFEYYTSGDDGQQFFHSFYWEAMTFTPATAHKITSVKLKLYRVGSPGTLTVSIRATSGGEPTGGDLCSGTTNANTLPEGAPYEWREITLGAGYDLDADTKYAIVARALSGNVSNYMMWRRDNSDPTYASGNREKSDDSGSSWMTYSGTAHMFEDWGIAAPTVTVQAVTNIQATTATGNGTITDNGGENPSKRGVCWNTTGNPTVADDKSEETDSFGTGAFTRPMTGLTPGQHYYVKAYAYNSEGYGYGSQVEFDTLALGWTGKISGVTNPAKVMGVDVANIASVKGVASA